MASSNAATKAFFNNGYGIVLAVYDTRRGQQEGREAEKILAFYPPTAPAAMQSSIVGLAQALTMFAGTFNKECPHHTMEAHRHMWALHHAEPDLWLLLVIGRQLLGQYASPSSLPGLLRGVHGLAVLLHGLLGTQLEQDPSGARLRLRLQPLLQDVASSLLQPDSPALFSLSSPLGLTGGAPLLPVSNTAFTRLQSLTNSLLVARLFGARPVTGLLVAWQCRLLWSSLTSDDSSALAALAVRALEPAAREGAKHRTWRRPLLVGPELQQQHRQQQQQQQQQPVSPSPSAAGGTGLPQLPTSTRSSSTTLSGGGGGGGAAAASATAAGGSSGSSGSSSLQADVMSLATAATWCCRPDGLLLPVWLEAAGGGGSNAGTPQQSAGGGSSSSSSSSTITELPLVWLQAGTEPARLMVWHSGPLLLLLLLEPQGPMGSSCDAVISSLLSILAAPAAALAAQLAAELPAKNLWHVKGLRYLYQDHLAAAARASPRRKVFTLSAASLHVAAAARASAALEATAAADPTTRPLGAPAGAAAAAAAAGGAGVQGQAWEAFAAGGEDADVEVVVKGANDSWVVVRHSGAGRQLTAVVESEKEGLPGVMRRVQGFCDSQCPGVFEGIS